MCVCNTYNERKRDHQLKGNTRRIGEKGKRKVTLYFNKKLKKCKTPQPHVQSSLIHNSQDAKQPLYPSVGRWISDYGM